VPVSSADKTVPIAWTDYNTYYSSQTSANYAAFYTAVQAAIGSTGSPGTGLNAVLTYLDELISTGSTATLTTEATALANDVISVQSSLPTPAVSTPPLHVIAGTTGNQDIILAFNTETFKRSCLCCVIAAANSGHF